MNEKFNDFVRKFASEKLAVAVSGGVDSVCMLHWMATAGMNITALHVNHGLRPAAGIEAEYVQSLCDKLNIPCRVFHWTDKKPSTGLEAAARDARYKMMTDWCKENKIKYLVVAHQADDQIETFLMNLGRGSGLYGLAAMRPESMRDGIKILRPMLGVFRSELIKYCTDNQIKFFSDEMNYDDKYTRVKIRQNRHLLSEKLGISDTRILLAIENLGRVRDMQDDNINQYINDVVRDGYALFSDSFLFDLGDDIRLKFLGTLIQKIGGNRYQPRLNSLNLALSKLHKNCQFTLGHCTIRRFNNQILVVPEGAKTSIRKKNEKIKRLKKQNKVQQ